jgi:hypothetical protein
MSLGGAIQIKVFLTSIHNNLFSSLLIIEEISVTSQKTKDCIEEAIYIAFLLDD